MHEPDKDVTGVLPLGQRVRVKRRVARAEHRLDDHGRMVGGVHGGGGVKYEARASGGTCFDSKGQAVLTATEKERVPAREKATGPRAARAALLAPVLSVTSPRGSVLLADDSRTMLDGLSSDRRAAAREIFGWPGAAPAAPRLAVGVMPRAGEPGAGGKCFQSCSMTQEP